MSDKIIGVDEKLTMSDFADGDEATDAISELEDEMVLSSETEGSLSDKLLGVSLEEVIQASGEIEGTDTEGQTDKTEGEEDKEEEDPDSGDGEDEAGDEEAESDSAITLKGAKEDYSVPEEALVDVKVGSELQQVSLAELKKNYSGKFYFDQRMGELNKDKVAFQKQMTSITSSIEKMGEMSASGDILGMLEYAAALANVDSKDVLDKHIDQSLALADKLQGASEDERSAILSGKKADYYKKQLDARDATAKAQIESEKEITYVKNIVAQAGYQIDEYTTAAQDLITEGIILDTDNTQAATSKTMEYLERVTVYKKIFTAAKNVGLELDPQGSIPTEMANMLLGSKKEFTIADIEEVLRQSADAPEEETSEEETPNRKAESTKATSKKASSKKKKKKDVATEEEDPVGFEDILNMSR